MTFVPRMHEEINDQRAIEMDLQHALLNDEFFLQYQPTFDLTTGDFNGVEALLRWRHPEKGLIQPSGFIPALESSGLIVSVGQWVLDEACQQGGGVA